MTKQEKDRWTMLAETAQELNTQFGLEPAIPTQGISENELEAKIMEAAELIEPADEFTEQTEFVLNKWFLDKEKEADSERSEEEPQEQEKEESKKQDQEISEEEDEKEDYNKLKNEINSLQKRKELRILAQENKDLFSGTIEKLQELLSADEVKKSMLKELNNINDKEEIKQKKEKRNEHTNSPQKEEYSVSGKKLPREGSKIRNAINIAIPLLKKGCYTQNEIIAKVEENCNASHATIHMLMAKSKNPDYCRFPKLVKKDPETKNLSF